MGNHLLQSWENWEVFPLDELPINVLAITVSKTTPRDACRLAAVNKRFAEAASSDLVWKEFLPTDVEETLRQQTVQGASPPYQCLKDLYNHLSNHLLLGDGTTGYFINRATGGVCRTFSARTLRIIWSNSPQYWCWLPSEGSRFSEVAFLKSVCWLDLSGEINCRLPPGVYTLSWVLKFERSRPYHRQHDGWDDAPVTFTATDGTEVCEKIVPTPSLFESVSRHRRRQEGSIFDQWLERQRSDRDEWWEYEAGDFTVMKADDADNLGDIRLKFSMKEITKLYWKSGLYVDGVILRSK